MSQAPAAQFERLLNPRGIAVIGASHDPQRIGGQPAKILRETGYRGAIYPVNPKYPEVSGLACYPNAMAVPRPCDVAIIAVNAAAVPQTIRDCGSADIPFAIIFSAGFREAGEAGAAREAELKAVAREAGVRFIGPNCIGTMNLEDRVYCGFGSGFANPDLKAGPVAFVSQSGGFAFSVVGLADHEGIGFNYVISAGNEADIGTLDLIEDFLERDDVEVVVSYMEGIADGTRLRAIGARALALGKPVLVWKVGKSEIGRRAAESHTASMTASYTLYQAAFEQGGFIEIEDVHELVDAARAFGSRRLPHGRRVAVVTTSGGSGVLIADACDQHGLELPQLAPDTVRALEGLAPRYAIFTNPIDLTAQVTGDHELVNRICALIVADPNVDQLIVRFGGVQGARGEAWANGIAAVAGGTDKPVLVAWSRPPDHTQASMQILERHRIPWLLTPTRTAYAAGVLNRFARRRERLLARPEPEPRPFAPRPLELPPGAHTLSEHESRRCLAIYDIPATRARLIAPDAIDRLKRAPLRYPLAVKIDSPDIAHKTEAGGVRLNVRKLIALKQVAHDVVAAARRHQPDARLNGVLVSEMAQGVEVIIGAVNDPFFGPVVMFGLGGVATELLDDVSYGFAPLDRQAAHDMIRATRAHPLLTGYRGRPPLALEALVDALVRLSLLAADHAERIAEIDVNPLFVGATDVAAADALVVLRG
ncbi:MAG: acetate--CoA ligase family protein [Betaproteobacteria bacterium]|nr:acetate--CoA ligase family protein [Betaproteobacteria bacterium]